MLVLPLRFSLSILLMWMSAAILAHSYRPIKLKLIRELPKLKAEERRAMAVALEQEMLAAVQEMRAKVVEAEAEVPKAMAEAFVMAIWG